MNDRAPATPAPAAAAPASRWATAPGFGTRLLLTLPALVLLGFLFVVPLGRLVALSVDAPHLTLSHYAALFSSPLYAEILLRTLRVSALVALGALFFGFPIAYVLATARSRLRAVVGLLVLLPFWTSILVRNYAWVYVLQRRGALNQFLVSHHIISQPLDLMFNETGVVIGMTNVLLPFMVLPVYVALRTLDRSLSEAAESLGASPSTTFFTVTLPLSLPGIYAGSLLVFATALGFFITPALLGGGRVLVAATYITQEVDQMLDWQGASAAAIVLLVLVIVLLALYTRIVSVERLTGVSDGGT